MQLLFYVVTLIPLKVVRIVTRSIVNLGVLSWTSGYKITKINLKLCYKDLSDKKLKSLTNKSYIESIVSIFETLNAWSRPIHVSGKKIYLNDLTYWNVELQEAYFSYKEAYEKREIIYKK